MFVYCDKCREYDSGDKDSMDELKVKVRQDGGRLDEGGSRCPACGAEGDGVLRVD